MTIVASWIVPLAGSTVPHGLVLVAVVAAAWAWQAARLRARERHLTLLSGQRLCRLGDSDWLLANPVERTPDDSEWAGGQPEEPAVNGAAAPEVGGGVLVVARRAIVPRVEGALDGVAAMAVADSAWSARVACRHAFDAGQPYNLVLLDASLDELNERQLIRELEADLQEWGARVAMLRPRSGGCEEGIRCHENPDRRGRIGFAAAARADAAPLGLRGDRRQ